MRVSEALVIYIYIYIERERERERDDMTYFKKTPYFLIINMYVFPLLFLNQYTLYLFQFSSKF